MTIEIEVSVVETRIGKMFGFSSPGHPIAASRAAEVFLGEIRAEHDINDYDPGETVTYVEIEEQ